MPDPQKPIFDMSKAQPIPPPGFVPVDSAPPTPPPGFTPVKGVPPGLIEEPIPQSYAVQGVPPGLVEEPIQGATPLFDMSKATPIDPEAAHAERAARSREGVDMSGGKDSTAMGLVTGFGKEAARTVSGAATLVNEGLNKVLPESAQLPMPPKVAPTQGAAETIGGGLENIGEYAVGEGLLGALKSFVQTPTAVMQLIEKYPTAARLITSMAKAGTVGAAQGAVKGAADNEAVKGGLEGGAGAAAGAGAFEGALESMGPLAKILGIGGRTPEEALTKAGRPYAGEHNWQQSAKTALPDLAKMDPSSIRKVGDFTDELHDSANEIREKEFQPMIDRHATDVLPTQSIAKNIEKAATPWMDKYEPKQSEEIRDFAKKFNGDMTLDQAESDLKGFNKALSKYYKAGPRDASGMLQTDGTIAKYEAAADGLRDLIYTHLKSVGEKAPEDVQARYGALKDLERVIAKRATVADNQAPMSLPQTIAGMGSIGALISGHPLEAAGGAAAIAAERARQNMAGPAGLIRQAIRGAGGESAGPMYAAGRAVASTARTLRPAAETAAGSLGEQAHDWIQVTGPDGQQYEVHPDDLDAAKERGAKIQ